MRVYEAEVEVGLQEVGRDLPVQERDEAEGRRLEEWKHTVASAAEAIYHREDMGDIDEVEHQVDMVVGTVVDSSYTAYIHHTLAQQEGTAGSGHCCKAVSYPCLYVCLALPADDDRSSCRLGAACWGGRSLRRGWR